MEHIRIGNDIVIRWSIFAGDAAYDLEGRDIAVFLKTVYGRCRITDYSVEGNAIKWTFYGKDQRAECAYSLELVENDAQKGMHTVDECDAFRLVGSSHECGCGDPEENVEVVSLQLKTVVTFPGGGGGSGLQYADERTVYPTRLEPEGNEPTDVEITEEERAYNIETYDMAWNRMEPGFVSYIGIHFNVIVMSDDMAAYNVVTHYSNAFVYYGLYSFTITITKEGDAIFSSKQIQTGGGSATPSDMNSDFSNDF
jgi:hypothetical protein